MSLVTLSTEKLFDLLNRAYEAGWYGSLELKEEVAGKLLDEVSLPVTTTVQPPRSDEVMFESMTTEGIIISSSVVSPEIIITNEGWRSEGDE